VVVSWYCGRSKVPMRRPWSKADEPPSGATG
jgi:hypothetical protein